MIARYRQYIYIIPLWRDGAMLCFDYRCIPRRAEPWYEMACGDRHHHYHHRHYRLTTTVARAIAGHESSMVFIFPDTAGR